MSRADGILFDKDGTLFDFHATWSVWAHGVIHDLSKGAPDVMARMAREPPNVWAAPCRAEPWTKSRIT